MNFCCVTWEGLAPELREAKEKELKKVVPQSLVYPILKLLKSIDQYCPACGSGLFSQTVTAGTPSRSKSAEPQATTKQTVVKCPACKGTGLTDKDDPDLKCSVCLGQGVFNSNTKHDTLPKDLPPPKIKLKDGEGIFIPAQ